MRILILEYITGGGMVTKPIPLTLLREGELMLEAVVTGLIQLPSIEVIVFRDARITLPGWMQSIHPVELLIIQTQKQFLRLWSETIDACDAVWPIAPETSGCLEDLCSVVEKKGKTLLNSSSEAVRQTASKLATSTLLSEYGIPIIPTFRLADAPILLTPPWVIKPDDGVGCEGSFIASSSAELAKHRSFIDCENYVIQPFVSGDTLSLSVLFEQGDAVLISANRQWVTVENGSFRLKGCDVNAVKDSNARLADLAKRIAGAFPGLWGYAGIDLMVSGKDLAVLEINPRLTTSFAGLSAALSINVAELIVNMVKGRRIFSSMKTRTTQSFFISLSSDDEI